MKSRLTIFNQSDDEEEEVVVKPSGLRNSALQKARDLNVQKRALEADPTIYEYDEIYDEISAEKTKKKSIRANDSAAGPKPKYVSKMVAAAEDRKHEFERHLERKMQKELQNDAEEFKGKERLITSSYRKKLEELRKLDEAKEHQKYLESIADVKKQPDLGGFYRNWFEKRTKQDSDDKDDDNDDKEPTPKSDCKKQPKSVETKPEPKPKIDKTIHVVPATTNEPEPVPSTSSDVLRPARTPKRDIWAKRTIGTVFDDAVNRYFDLYPDRRPVKET